MDTSYNTHVYSCTFDCKGIEQEEEVLRKTEFSSETGGNLKWKMNFRQDGWCTLNFEVSLGGKTVRVIRNTSLFNADGKDVYRVREDFKITGENTSMTPITFDGDFLTEKGLMKKKTFDFTIRCKIHTLEKYKADRSVAVPSTEIHCLRDLAKSYLSPENSDVTLRVEEESIPAHRLVLTLRSSVFYDMLQRNSEEKEAGVVLLDDFKTRIVKDTLRFMYTGCPPKFTESWVAEDLLMAAHKYAIDDLKILCEDYLISTTTAERVWRYAELAHSYSAHRLKNYCIQFIRLNEESLKCNSLESFNKKLPDLFLEIFKALTDKNNRLL